MALTRTVPELNPEITPQTLVIFPINEEMIDTSQLSEEDRKYLESYKKHLDNPEDPEENEK